MHVTKVELENIKSYEHAVFTFERGVTAITGENGAGKTTILEAIAWALFDTLEYSKEDFLRRGAKKGNVRVTFETDEDIDGRQYTVYRDTGAGYYIYDPGLGGKIAEQRTNVAPLLRQLLGIEASTDIRALFTSAIGVPQGTFTADFLRPATQRKASFDKLLKVEEYREGAERLRDTVRLIGERTTEVRERIAGAEGQLANYDQLVAEHKEARERVGELEQSLAALQKEIAERARVIEEMDRAETLVTETRSRMDRLEVERDAAARRTEDAGRERDAASLALEKQRAAEAGYKAHLEVLETIARLEAERAKREQLRERVQKAEAMLATSKAHVKSLEDALLRATQAAQAVVALETEVSEQMELEKERERLRDLRARAISARERLTQLDKELELLRSQHVQTRERMKDAERGQGAQERVARLESERLGVETSLSNAEKAATSLKHLTNQKREAARETERLRREIGSHEKLIVDLQQRSQKAAEAAPLALRETELTERLANLKAEIARDEKFHAEVKGGLCPILSERCLNIGEGQTLEDYFKDSFAINTTQLKALEKERASVTVAVREAREAEKHLTKLESARLQVRNAQELLTEREATLKRIDSEIAALPDAKESRLSELKFQLFGIDGELKDVREAAMRYAELQPLQDRLKEIEQEGKRRKEDRANVAAEADAVAGLEKDIAENESRLRALRDPRARAAVLRAEAESEEARRAELTAALDAQRVLEEEAQAQRKELEQYARLDAEWTEARGERDRTSAAHLEYLANEALASTLPARLELFDKALNESERVKSEASKAAQDYERASAAYNRERHSQERAHLSASRELSAATSAKLDEARARESALDAEITKLAEVRERRREDFLAKERLENLNDATEFIRDTLKAAGPIVTESYLYNISIEANQLFREITGDAGRTLRWSRDYEIVLEEEGHERSFPNLSGGEQMAAALSIRLALLKQLSDIRVAFFDEPTVNMDEERRERLAQQIGEIKHFDQLFVISHDDTFEESVDHTLHIERKSKGAGHE